MGSSLSCPYHLVVFGTLDRDLESRDKLRNEFWSTIDSYLDDLECPKGYLLMEEAHGVAWRQDPSLRLRVVYWIISCATSELHAELSKPKPKPKEQVHATAMERTPAKLRLPELDPSAFPLGFSTGDDQVDHILILLRMNLLHEVEQEQQQYNQLLANSILETSRDKETKTMPKKSGRHNRG